MTRDLTPPLFKAGDRVRLLPDIGYGADYKDEGVVIGPSDCGNWLVEVKWKGVTADLVHVTRIAHATSRET